MFNRIFFLIFFIVVSNSAFSKDQSMYKEGYIPCGAKSACLAELKHIFPNIPGEINTALFIDAVIEQNIKSVCLPSDLAVRSAISIALQSASISWGMLFQRQATRHLGRFGKHPKLGYTLSECERDDGAAGEVYTLNFLEKAAD